MVPFECREFADNSTADTGAASAETVGIKEN
jgi:hypothetical protein